MTSSPASSTMFVFVCVDRNNIDACTHTKNATEIHAQGHQHNNGVTLLV